MNVLILAPPSSGWGGTEANTLGIVLALVDAGHRVTLVQLGHDLYDRFAGETVGYELKHVPLPAHFSKLSLDWWRNLLRRFEPDVCVLSKGGFESHTAALDIAARMSARRYVLLEHHPADPPPPRTSRRYLGGLVPGLGLWWWKDHLRARFHLQSAHRVITDSDHVTNLLCAYFGLNRAKAFRVYPGVDPTVFAVRHATRERVRAEWRIPPSALVIGAVGRIAAVKGFERAVRALFELRSIKPEQTVRLVLAGDGPDRAELESAAKGMGIADCVVMPGYVQNAADALSAIDVYLMPSREEGFGIALVEAMSCERVCVAMNSGGPGEILTDPSLGWLTPRDDQESFTKALLAAAALSPADRAAMGSRARAHVEAHFNQSRQMAEIARLITTA